MSVKDSGMQSTLDPFRDEINFGAISQQFRNEFDKVNNFDDIVKYFKQYTQATGIIDAFNQYFTEGLQKQLDAVTIPIEFDGKKCFIMLKMMNPLFPTYVDSDGKSKPRTPARCRNLKISYVSSISVYYMVFEEDTRNLVKSFEQDPVHFADLPVMVGSQLCYRSHARSREDLIRLGENPDDPGGYFIRKGNVNVIPNSEKMQIDRFFILHNKKRGYHARQTINVPSGTAISEIIERTIEDSRNLTACHYTTTKLGKVEGKSRKHKGLNSINILHLIDIIALVFYRKDLLPQDQVGDNHYGVQKILQLICTDDEELRAIQKAQVFHALQSTILEYEKKSTGEALSEFLTWIEVDKNSKNQVLKRSECCRAIQERIFQTTPVYKENGKSIVEPKINMICALACHFLLFRAGIIPATNRDDWSNKKLDTATIGISQSFWKVYNRQMITIASKVSTTSGTKGTLPKILEANHAKQFTSAFMAPFTEQIKKGSQGTTGTAFIPSQKVHPTNVFDLISFITKIQVSINKTVKNPGIRNIHGSQRLYVCPGKTPDGSTLGIVQFQAMLAQCTVNDGSDQITKALAGYYTSEKTVVNRNCLYINGREYGWCDGLFLRDLLYRMRRGDPSKFTLEVDEDECIVKSVWYPFDTRDRVLLTIDDISDVKSEIFNRELFIDGDSEGFIDETSVKALKDWARVGSISSRTTFAMNEIGHLTVYDNSGRLKTPMYVVRDNIYQIDGKRFNLLIDDPRYETSELSFNELEKRGFIDWIDAYEESDPNFYQLSCKREFYAKMETDEAIIAKHEELSRKLRDSIGLPEVVREVTEELNEIEDSYHKINASPCRCVSLNEIAMYSTAASIAPASHHDPAGKTTHTAKTVPQTLGLQSNAYIHQKEHFSIASNIPLSTPSIGFLVGDQRAFLGVDASVAFIDMGMNQEDAVILSTSLLDTKMMMYATQNTIKAELSVGGTGSHYLGIPPDLSEGAKEKYKHLTEYGLPPIGYRLKPDEIAISYYSIKEDIVQKREVTVGKSEEGIVKDILFYREYARDGENQRDETVVVSILVQNIKHPVSGDKFSLPHGQKSVVGEIKDRLEIPYDSLTGFQPDILCNSHAINGRQTIGVFLDMVIGLTAAQIGKFFDTTAFIQDDFPGIIRFLKERGYGFKNTRFIDPITGRSYPGISYTGFTRLHQLHHFADEKMDAIGHAEINVRTKRRNKNAATAGQKIGRMESKILISYGMIENFKEKFMTLSDSYTAYICKSCRQMNGSYSDGCPYCKEFTPGNILRCQIPSTYNDVKDLLLMNSIRIYSDVGQEEEFAENYMVQIKEQAGVDGGIEIDIVEENDGEQVEI